MQRVHPSVLKIHAKAPSCERALEGSGFVVRDVGSLNGTYVNRRRIESQRLSDGDELQIGKFKLTFLKR